VVDPISLRKNLAEFSACNYGGPNSELLSSLLTYLISQCLLETKLSEITISFEAECLPKAAPFSPTIYTLLSNYPSTAFNTKISLFGFYN
jgi:hypothetical protein